MPLTTTQVETGKIIAGEIGSVTRAYPDGCPHAVGAELILAGPDDSLYAIVTVKSLRPSSIEDRRSDDDLAKGDGFSCGAAWYAHFAQLYGSSVGLQKDVTRIQFKIKELIGND